MISEVGQLLVHLLLPGGDRHHGVDDGGGGQLVYAARGQGGEISGWGDSKVGQVVLERGTVLAGGKYCLSLKMSHIKMIFNFSRLLPSKLWSNLSCLLQKELF